MYLKSLELMGFKSFADKTRLEFPPGMTAIVGPNGCGKSNIADAVRWVLGEQSAKALRGSRMEDCIFNGTEERKPLGMAEVSLTLSDCEGVLGTEFHEVTVTRRVFRSGEGQYFLNRTPCRLKDIQRLFMDTGIGTSSYSLMEQGKIDLILSSRPEDRREVFEEASGITRYKADKKEALQKLEHTEANLLRLADVISEVKRQIGSLQRQAAKARRYKEYREELRRLDIFLTRKRLAALDEELRRVSESKLAAETETKNQERRVAALEEQVAAARELLLQLERDMASVGEAMARAKGAKTNAQDLIRINAARIEEYRKFAERDSKEIEEGRKQQEQCQTQRAELARRMEGARADQAAADQAFRLAEGEAAQHRRNLEATRINLRRLREELLDREGILARLQNQIAEWDSHERTRAFQRERLAAERAQFTRAVAAFDKRLAEMETRLDAQRRILAEREADRIAREEAAQSARERVEQARRRLAELQARCEALETERRVLRETLDATRSPALRRLMERKESEASAHRAILGELLSLLDVPSPLRPAVHAVLHAWQQAVVVSDAAIARSLLKELGSHPSGVGPACLIAVPPAHPTSSYNASGPGLRLLDSLSVRPELRPLAEHLLGPVRLVESLEDVPTPVPSHLAYVTRNGLLIRGECFFEIGPSSADGEDPLHRTERLAKIEAEIAGQRQEMQEQQAAVEALSTEAATWAAERDDASRHWIMERDSLVRLEGEREVIAREAVEVKQRLETVTWELESVDAQIQTGPSEREQRVSQRDALIAERDRLKQHVADNERIVQALEEHDHKLQTVLTEKRMHLAHANHLLEQLEREYDHVRRRLAEWETTIQTRQNSIASYQTGMAEAQSAIRSAEKELALVEQEVHEQEKRHRRLREQSQKQAETVKELEATLAEARGEWETAHKTCADFQLELTRLDMQRQSHIDRLSADYADSPEKLLAEPPPEFPDGEPTLETLETALAELRTKIEAMGAINLVAIEELQQLEERHAFLAGQEQDLVKAKQQLLNLIRQINRTTTEMFRTTFDRINQNFQTMFERLFGGGTARLVLVNEEDVLECGIEIIVRPPGKRLQNVSLLSGGERTLTTVALLFAIYMTKPSPFCVLDELDAALDDTNIIRFVQTLQDFLKTSQFIVITHNRQTIAAANTLYGVTMPEKGVSAIMSMKFKDIEADPARMQVTGSASPQSIAASAPASVPQAVSTEGTAAARASSAPPSA